MPSKQIHPIAIHQQKSKTVTNHLFTTTSPIASHSRFRKQFPRKRKHYSLTACTSKHSFIVNI